MVVYIYTFFFIEEREERGEREGRGEKRREMESSLKPVHVLFIIPSINRRRMRFKKKYIIA